MAITFFYGNNDFEIIVFIMGNYGFPMAIMLFNGSCCFSMVIMGFQWQL